MPWNLRVIKECIFLIHTHLKICTKNPIYYKNKFSLMGTLIFFHKALIFFSQTHSGLHEFRKEGDACNLKLFYTKETWIQFKLFSVIKICDSLPNCNGIKRFYTLDIISNYFESSHEVGHLVINHGSQMSHRMLTRKILVQGPLTRFFKAFKLI